MNHLIINTMLALVKRYHYRSYGNILSLVKMKVKYQTFKWIYGHLLVLLMILTLIAGCRSAAPKTTETSHMQQGWTKGEGMAQIYQGDVSLAKDRALRAAKRDAIRRKLGELVRSKTITESGVWVKGEVSAQSQGLVKDYMVVSNRQASQAYKIEILADVPAPGLIDAVEDLLNDWEKPVMFGIVTEIIQSKKESPYFNNALQGLEKYFLEKGFILNKTSNFQRFLGHSVNISKISKIFAQKKLEPDFDLLVFGSSKCYNAGKIKYQGFKSNLFSSQVTASVSIFDIHTKRLIASASGSSAYPHMNFNIGCSEGFSKKLMPQLGDRLFKQMLKKWKKEYASGRPILVELKGKIPYKKLNDFQIVLRNEVRGVIDIIERNFSSERAALEIIYEGKTVDFVEEFMNKKLPLSLRLISKSGRRLFLTAQ